VVSKVMIVHRKALLLAEREVLTILGDPHNELRLAVLVVDCNRVAHRIRSAENSAGECLVYDDNGLRALPVGGRELAPLQDRNCESVKIIRSDIVAFVLYMNG